MPEGGQVISSKLHLEFGTTGTATVLAAIVAPAGSSISIGGISIAGSPFGEDSETFNVNPRGSSGGLRVDFDFEIPEGGGAGSASIRVCFYPVRPASRRRAGRSSLNAINSVTGRKSLPRRRYTASGRSRIPIPASMPDLHVGGVDDSLWIRVGKTWAKAEIFGKVW